MTDATKQSLASQGGESLPMPLPETVAECHLVIETLLQRLAQLHEQLQVLQERTHAGGARR